MVDVYVDPQKLAEVMGHKAQRNNSGEARAVYDAILVKVRE